MKILFVHGWNVHNLNSYGELPEAIQKAAPNGMNIEIHNIHLGRYINFHDEVTLDDVARAFDLARRDCIGDASFSCITHSTGGPVVRLWLHLFYGLLGDFDNIPLQHLIMLAPANNGSPLAALGKSTAARIFKRLFEGVEPGAGLLTWLQLGSQGQRELNLGSMEYSPADHGCYPFVLTGETIDHHFYDFLNSYLVEPGSDGVVRVSGANMNYKHIKLVQNGSELVDGYDGRNVALLEPSSGIKASPEAPLVVVRGASHSGKDIGIMRSITEDNYEQKTVVEHILRCLSVRCSDDYQQLTDDFKALTTEVQLEEGETENQHCAFVFRVWDDRNNAIEDFDMLLLAESDYHPGKLPKGFFQDRQFNKQSKALIYYLNYSQLKDVSHLGFRINARPDSGFSYYLPIEFRSDGHAVSEFLQPNQTVFIDVTIKRFVDKEVFRFEGTDHDRDYDFKKVKPSGQTI
ncbi:hypothetical protein [Halodesulfovibrio aestuarii]|uniref:hypothetical protein n=1 Tax=Halodesulfovibrio aestuarii TaxID=126333 RepID=UPI003D3510F9